MGTEILNKAIELEEKAIELYSKALKIVQHESCREVIQLLFDQEKIHIEDLKNIYNEIKQKGAWPEKRTFLVEDKLSNVFKSACTNINKTLKPNSDEKEFLDLCMALENKGKKLYQTLAEEAEDAKEKKFYETLSKEEEKHYEFLEQYCNYYWDSGLRMQD